MCRTLHVGMIQRRQDSGSALETRDAIGVSSEDGEDHLHANVAARPRVPHDARVQLNRLTHATAASISRIVQVGENETYVSL